MRTGSHTLLLGPLACLVGLASPALAAPAAPTPVAHGGLAGFRPGESFIFNFSVGSIQAGRARLAVGAPKDTPTGPRVALNGDAESAPWLALLAHVKDTYKSQLDADGVPATRRVQIEEHGLRERTIDFILDRLESPVDDRLGGATRLTLDITKPNFKRHETHDLGGRPLDLVGSLFFIRFQPLAVGDRFEFVFFDGPMFYRAHAVVAGREQLTWSGGPARAVRLDIDAERVDWQLRTIVGPGAEKRHAKLLLSDDTDHIPYRIEGDTDFGLCQIELIGYIPGGAPVLLEAKREAPAPGPAAQRLLARPTTRGTTD